jgi:hypothetical protein
MYFCSRFLNNGVTISIIAEDMVTYILQVDPSKQDDLTRIENRPMDEPLCTKYNYLCLFETDLPNQL